MSTDGMKAYKVWNISPALTYGVLTLTPLTTSIPGLYQDLRTIDLKNIEEVQERQIVNVAAGYDHIALDENSGIYVWGNRRLGRICFPTSSKMAAAYGAKGPRHQADRGQQPSSPRLHHRRQ